MSKKTKEAYSRPAKKVQYKENPSLYSMTPNWSFLLCDSYHEVWGIAHNGEHLAEMLMKFKEWERGTWADILMDTSGRNGNTKSHPIPVGSLTRDAQKRLEELHHAEEVLYSLALTGRRRIWGIMIPETGTFQFLWYDSEHAIYPVDKK